MSNRQEINDFPGYEIDTDGNIWSCLKDAKGGMDKSNWHSMKWLKRGNYYYVALSLNGKHYNRLIHRLVAETFLDNPEQKPMVCHKDGNPENNKVENLYWGTALENQWDRKKHGTTVEGTKNGQTKLNEKQVRVIKHALNLGVSDRILSRMASVSPATIWFIRRGIRWGHVQI